MGMCVFRLRLPQFLPGLSLCLDALSKYVANVSPYFQLSSQLVG